MPNENQLSISSIVMECGSLSAEAEQSCCLVGQCQIGQVWKNLSCPSSAPWHLFIQSPLKKGKTLAHVVSYRASKVGVSWGEMVVLILTLNKNFVIAYSVSNRISMAMLFCAHFLGWHLKYG